MRKRSGIIFTAVLLLASSTRAGSREGDGHGFAELHDRLGHSVGDVELHQEDGELEIHVELYSLAPGDYVLTAHSTAECTPPFSTAGKKLPLASAERDSLLIHVEADGSADLHFRTTEVSLHGQHALFDWNGSSFLLALASSENLQLACGVVKI